MTKASDAAAPTPRDRAPAAKGEYIEEVGLFLEAHGGSRMAGRVLGALLVAEPAEQTADELKDTLRASRSSISVALRTLERMGYVDRVSKAGERKDYFRNRPDAWTQMVERQLEGVRRFRELAERGLDLLETDDPEVRRGLIEMRDFFAFFEREHPKILEDWQQELEERKRTHGSEARRYDDGER